MTAAAAPQEAPVRRRDRRTTAAVSTGLGWFTVPRIMSIAVPLALVLLALTPLHAVYLTGFMWVSVGVGAVLGAAIAVAGAMRRWPTLTVLAFALPVFFLFGALAAPATALGGVLPTLTTWQLMGRGVVTVWKQVLTIAPPLGTTGVLLLLPYLLAFFGALIAVTVSVRAKRWSLSLLVPLVVGVVSILFSTRTAVAPGVIGVAAVGVSIVWVAWRAGRLELHRVIAVPLVIGLVAIGGTATALVAQPTSARFVLRDLIDPPPDPHDYASPLAGMRRYVDGLADQTLFTATGLPATAQRLRLASMDYFDGHSWGIASSTAAGTGTFNRPGERLVTTIAPNSAIVNVSIGAYTGVWLPNVGSTEDVDFGGPRAEELADGFYFNTASDTGLVSNVLREDDSYVLTANPEPDVVAAADDAPDTSMLQTPVEDLSMPDPVGVPDVIATLAAEYSKGGRGDYERVNMIANRLHTGGYFSHGLEGEPPSRPGHGAARLAAMLDGDQIIGDAEQYAAAMALMVRELGLPARVVIGFNVPAGTTAGQPVEITGSNVTAWVEVPFQGYGWLPFFPTPDEDQVPQVQDPQPQDRPEPQVLQPPQPPEEPAVVPPLDRGEAAADQERPTENRTAELVLFYLGVVGIPVLVLAAPLLIIAFLKARRWRKRRRVGPASARIAGGWAELSDRVLDLGIVTTRGATRREAAHTFDRGLERTRTTVLAQRADSAVFAPEPPSQAEIDSYWADVASAVKVAHKSVSWRRRVKARFTTRSLRRR